MNLNRQNLKNIMSLIAFAVLLYVGLQNLDIVLGGVAFVWRLLFPFILGGAIAFILNVPMNFLQKKCFGRLKESSRIRRIARPLSLIGSLLFVIAVILLVVLVVAPAFGDTLVTLIKNIEKNLPIAQKWLIEVFHNNAQIAEWIADIEIDIPKIVDTAWGMLKTGADSLVSSTVSVTMGLINVVTDFGIGFIFACYILLSKETLIMQFKKALYAIFPVKVSDNVCHVLGLANRTFSNFVTGQCIEAVILGSMFFVSMTILRFPYAVLVGVLIAFTALIPIVGGFIGCGIGFIFILIENPMQAFMFLILFLVLQQIEGNLIYPHVVGGSVGLPSIWVLMAVSVGGSLMGIVGMLVFIPLVSVLYALFKEWAYVQLDRKGITEKKWAVHKEE